MRLTMNQKETLHVIVTGYPGGMLAKPIPSLIKHGLVTTIVTPGVYHEPTRTWVKSARTDYRLTPLGLETYTKLRTAMHDAEQKKVEGTFRQHLSWAAARTVK